MRNIIKVLLNEGIEREDVVAICKYIKEEYEEVTENVVDNYYKSKINDAEGKLGKAKDEENDAWKVARKYEKRVKVNEPLTWGDDVAVNAHEKSVKRRNAEADLDIIKNKYSNLKKEQEESSNK